MKDIFKNIDWKTWFIQNILWFLFFSIILIGTLKFLKSIYQAFIISKKILKKNRSTMANGYGNHYADVFIEIWFKNNLKETEVREYRCCYASNIASKKALKFQASELLKLQLIKKVDEKLQPIENFRNKCVLFLTKFYLIHCIGDNKKYYLDLIKK